MESDLSAVYPQIQLLPEHVSRGVGIRLGHGIPWIYGTTSGSKPLKAALDLLTEEGMSVIVMHSHGYRKVMEHDKPFEPTEVPKTYRQYTLLRNPEQYTMLPRGVFIAEVIPPNIKVPLFCEVEFLIQDSDFHQARDTLAEQICSLVMEELDILLGSGRSYQMRMLCGKSTWPGQEKLIYFRLIFPNVIFGSLGTMKHFVQLMNKSCSTKIPFCITKGPNSSQSEDCFFLDDIYEPYAEVMVPFCKDNGENGSFYIRPISWEPLKTPRFIATEFDADDFDKNERRIMSLPDWYLGRGLVPPGSHLVHDELLKAMTHFPMLTTPFNTGRVVRFYPKSHPLRTCVLATLARLYGEASLQRHVVYNKTTGHQGEKHVFYCLIQNATCCNPPGPKVLTVTLGYQGRLEAKCDKHNCAARFIGFPDLKLSYMGLDVDQLPEGVQVRYQCSQYLQVQNFINNDRRPIAIRSAQGSGKTTALIQAAKTFRITIIVVPRILLGKQYHYQLRQASGFANTVLYSDQTDGISSMISSTTVSESGVRATMAEGPIVYITTFESLHKIADLHMLFDTDQWRNVMLVIDEMETEIKSMLCAKTNTQYMTRNYNCLREMMIKVGKCCIMDAELSNASMQWFKTVLPKREIQLIINLHPGRQRRIRIVSDWIDILIDHLTRDRRCFVAVASVRFGRNLLKKLKELFPTKNIQFYHRDADDLLKADVHNVNLGWENVDCVICTSIGSVGISYDTPGVFYCTFVYLTPNVWTYVDASQMPGRIRHPITDDIYVMSSKQAPYGKCKLDLEETRRFHQNYRENVIKRYDAQTSRPTLHELLPEELMTLLDVSVQRQLIWRWSPIACVLALAMQHAWEISLDLFTGESNPTLAPCDIKEQIWKTLDIPEGSEQDTLFKVLRQKIIREQASEADKLHLRKLLWADVVGPKAAADFKEWERFCRFRSGFVFLSTYISKAGNASAIHCREGWNMYGRFLETCSLRAPIVGFINRIFDILGLQDIKALEGHPVNPSQVEEASNYIATLHQEGKLKVKISTRPVYTVNHVLLTVLSWCKLVAEPTKKHTKLFHLRWVRIANMPLGDLVNHRIIHEEDEE